MLRGNVPVKEMVKNQKDWISKIGLTLFGKTLVQTYPYEKLFLLDGADKIKKAVQIPVIYIGGIQEMKDVSILMNKGFNFMQVGRALIHNPDFIKEKKPEEPLCDICNRCVAAMDAGGVYCVSREKGYMEN